MMSHIFEAAPFPSPDSCGGGLSGIDPIYPLYVLTEFSKVVLTKWTTLGG